jgi:hypothetical protein
MAYAGMDRDHYPGDNLMRRLKDTTNLNWTGYYLPRLNNRNGQTISSDWQGHLGFLRGLGWGVVPIFFGRQQEHRVQATDKDGHPRTDDAGKPIMVGADWDTATRRASLTKGHGSDEGRIATNFAAAEGFPARTVIYLDIEGGNDVTDELADYYAAWSQAVFDNNYYPGVYCSPRKAPALMKKDTRPLVWAAAYRFSKTTFPIEKKFPITDPSGSGYALSDAWQLAGDCFVSEIVTGLHGRKATRILRDDHGAPFNVDFNTSILRDPGRFLDF